MTKWKKASNAFIYENAFGRVLDVGSGKNPYPGATTLNLNRVFVTDIIADANKEIPVPNESFDCVIMNNVLEHLHTPQRAIDEAHRVLRQGGILLATTPFFIKLHCLPDYHRYTELALERMFQDFDTEITMPDFTLNEIHEIFQEALLSKLGRRHTIQKLLFKALNYTLPKVYHGSYPIGHFIKAVKK